MADTQEEFGPKQQLQGMSNYIDWARNFQRAAKAQDVLNVFQGKETLYEKEPKINQHVIYNSTPEYEAARIQADDAEMKAEEAVNKSMHDAKNLSLQEVANVAIDNANVLADKAERLRRTSGTDPTLSLLSYEEAVRKYTESRKKKLTAMALLEKWVSPGIAIELEQFDDDPHACFTYIVKRFQVSDESERTSIEEN